jgi:signal transduction histidine kinase/ActR/RegA family two-component response regulator
MRRDLARRMRQRSPTVFDVFRRLAGMSEVSKPRGKNVHPLRDALLAGIITFVTSAVGLSIVYLKAHDAQVSAVQAEMLQLARAIAATVDPDEHSKLVSPAQEGSPEHLKLVEPLARMHRGVQDVWYVYTGVYRNGRIHWVLDSATLFRIPGNTTPTGKIMERYEVRDEAFERAYRDGVEYTDPKPRRDADGHLYLTVAVPIRDGTGKAVAMLGMDMVLDKLEARMATIRGVLYLALGVVLLLSIGAGVVAHRVRKFAAGVISKLRKARTAAEQNAEAAQSATRAKASFLAMMSHEIRTPMNGILGVADLLRTMHPTREQKRLLDILTSSGGSLLRIINDVLDFSKMEADRLELHPRAMDLRAFAGELEHLLAPPALAKRVAFRIETDPGLPAGVIADRERLSQALLNLGTNAVKFTDHGEVTLAIRAQPASGDNARIEFSVTDTGIGMDAAALARLFTPFTQVADAQRHRAAGTGLGLVIARKLVNLMGGDISVRSVPGQGSTFSFMIELPVTQLSGSTTTVNTLRLDSLAVLVAEDNSVNQAIVVAMLRSLGHRATLAGNGREALVALANEEFDLVLMDCNMPELDGLEATRQLRAGQSGARDPGIPVIALTANAMDGDREACLGAGMDGFVSKPVSIATLRQAIERVRTARAAA